MANKRYLEVVTSSSCNHCRSYVTKASKYLPVREYDIIQGVRKVKGVPYSFLFEDVMLIREWLGNDLTPIFGDKRMKIKFTRDCQDKYTGEIYNKGTVKDFPEERAEELKNLKVAKDVSE